jgi:hypothetical protein
VFPAAPNGPPFCSTRPCVCLAVGPPLQELQQLADAASASDAALQQCRGEAADARAAASQASARAELAAAASGRQVGALEEALEAQRRDIATLAEHVGSCLAAAALGDKGPPPSVSYLSSLLAPPPAERHALGGGRPGTAWVSLAHPNGYAWGCLRATASAR